MAGIVITAPSASAQTAGVDQYAPGPPGGGENPSGGGGNNPGGNDGTGGGGGNNGGGGGPEGAAGGGDEGPASVVPGAATGETDAGDLPFTGYPVTWLLLIVLALVAAGTLFRLVSAAARRRAGHATP